MWMSLLAMLLAGGLVDPLLGSLFVSTWLVLHSRLVWSSLPQQSQCIGVLVFKSPGPSFLAPPKYRTQSALCLLYILLLLLFFLSSQCCCVCPNGANQLMPCSYYHYYYYYYYYCYYYYFYYYYYL